MPFEWRTEVLRLALLNTPRSGSTWLRCLLATMLELKEVSAFAPEEIDWAELPARGVVHLHAHRSRPMLELLRRHRLRPVVVRRHPLDVLISILHFAPHEPATARWLGGEGGDERLLHDATPMSDSFLRYATGPRAKALLSLSPAWAEDENAIVVGYEQLVAAPEEGLHHIASELSTVTVREPREAVALHSLARHRTLNRNQHYWRGQPGLWRRLLTRCVAQEIESAQGAAFRVFGYACDADPELTPETAAANWEALRVA
jgi:hypothetical protein